MFTMQKGAILRKCVNTFVPHCRFRTECERHIPDTNDVEPAQAANAYLFLKGNFDVNRV